MTVPRNAQVSGLPFEPPLDLFESSNQFLDVAAFQLEGCSMYARVVSQDDALSLEATCVCHPISGAIAKWSQILESIEPRIPTSVSAIDGMWIAHVQARGRGNRLVPRDLQRGSGVVAILLIARPRNQLLQGKWAGPVPVKAITT